MQAVEEIVIYATGLILLIVTAGKFILKELISLVLLAKELKLAIKGDYPGPPETRTRSITRKPYKLSSGKTANRLKS